MSPPTFREEDLPPDEQIWALVSKIVNEISLLSTSDNPQDRALFNEYLLGSATNLESVMQMYDQLRHDRQVLRATQLALLLERNFHLEKLRAIERLGRESNWEGEGDGTIIYPVVKEILYSKSH